MTVNCYKCKILCTLKEPKGRDEMFGSACDSCKRVVCKSCSEISSTEIRAVVLSAKVLKFFCPDCQENIRNLPKLQSQVQKLQEEMEEIKKSLKLVQEKPSYSEVLKSVAKDNQELKAEIITLKKAVDRSDMEDEIEAAKKNTQQLMEEVEKLRETTAKGDTVNKDGLPVEPAIQEMLEREVRASNLLLFGVRESDKKSREERTKHERETVQRIVGGICEGFETTNLKIFRLGKYSEGKLRPIKMVFPSKEEALKILKRKNNLSETEGVYIKCDQTPSQRQYLRQVLAELEDRKNREGQDLAIRYINGVPRIIKFRRKPDSTSSKN